MVRRLDTRLAATFMKNASVKRGIVGGNKVYASKLLPNFPPDFTERWFIPNITPGYSVQIRKDKFLPGRSNQGIFFANDAAFFRNDNCYGARAITAIVRGFEVQGREFGKPDNVQQAFFTCLLFYHFFPIQG
jgi:hypothetical protein